MPGSPIVFFILAAVAVGTALGMLFSRNALYSALFLALNFGTIAMIYLIMDAPFIALSQITVYAGSIMVLFLFVIMLLGADRLPTGNELSWQPLVAIPLVIILAADFALNLFGRGAELIKVVPLPENFGSPQMVGTVLFTKYMLPFEVTAVLLLAATVGAIILAKPDRASAGDFARRARGAPRRIDAESGLELPYGSGNQPLPTAENTPAQSVADR